MTGVAGFISDQTSCCTNKTMTNVLDHSDEYSKGQNEASSTSDFRLLDQVGSLVTLLLTPLP